MAGKGRMQRRVPAALWRFYPLFVDNWMALLVLGLVMLGFPVNVGATPGWGRSSCLSIPS